MGHLRLVHAAPPALPAATTCLEGFEREFSYLFETLQRLGANHAEAEDLAQEVFLILQRRWPTFDTTRPLRPYLFGIAFRVVCAHKRRRAREMPFAMLDVEDNAQGPEGSFQSRESVALLMAALERVPLKRRVVVIMHDLDDVPVMDIAETLSISRFGTYARLRKGRKELAAAVTRLLKEGVRR